MSSAAATACTCTPRCRLRRTAASLNSALYSWTFFGPARGTRHLPLLGGSVYKSEAGSPASFKRLLGRAASEILTRRTPAQRQGTEHHTAVVHGSHDRVQHRVSLDRGGSMVRGDQKLQHHKGDRGRPAADRVVRPERPRYQDVH